MRLINVITALLPFGFAKPINVIQSNDDGWAEINIRELYYSLTSAGFNSIVSAPADNESGTGSFDKEPEAVGSGGCEFNSCPAGSPPTGHNISMSRFNYVNSYPVTSMRFGIQNLSAIYFGGPPDIAVAGFNVGNNIDLATLGSGTIGAATEAVKLGIPGIAFSGATGNQTAWNAPRQSYMELYADLSTLVTQTLTRSSKPFLPHNIWLNVNFPRYEPITCSSVSQVKFVFSRIHPAIPLVTPKDVEICGNGGRLPTERSVINTSGCYASLSAGYADTKFTAEQAEQAHVLDRLHELLTCLPSQEADVWSLSLL